MRHRRVVPVAAPPPHRISRPLLGGRGAPCFRARLGSGRLAPVSLLSLADSAPVMRWAQASSASPPGLKLHGLRRAKARFVKNHHRAKTISDASWAAFLAILSYKAACAGRSGVAVNPAFTSQTCSGCGVQVHKGSSVRWHTCPKCGTSLHRDHNAAKYRERLGQSRRGGAALVWPQRIENPWDFSPCGVSTSSRSCRSLWRWQRPYSPRSRARQGV